MSNIANGGVWALAGYLYQIVGTLSITARTFDSTTSSVDELDDIDVLFNLLDVGEALEAHPERYEQDAILRNQFDKTDKCVIVQFKYSVSSRKINKPELVEILDKLDKSAKEARSKGQDVTACVLITNREFTARGGAAKGYWKAQEGQELGYKLRRVCVTLEDWIERLRRFGRTYGVFDHEMEHGIRELVGGVVCSVGGQHLSASIIKEDLIEAFTRSRQARPLTPKHVSKHSSRQLNDFSEGLGLEGQPVRRELLDEIRRAIVERALVVLHGRGGCGKTVALWQWVQELVSLSISSKAFATVNVANDIRRSWVTELVCNWGELPVDSFRRSEPIERTLERLRIANPDLPPPILYLGLDGLDEEIKQADQVHTVQEVLQWFWNEDNEVRHGFRQQPRATLVVTCRDEEDLVKEWLRLEISGFPYRGERPLGIEVGNFSWQELKDAANDNLPKDLSDRIEGTIQLVIHGGSSDLLTNTYEPLPFGTKVSFPSPLVDEDVLEVLRHPAMWRSFLEFKPVSQLRILDGKPELAGELAEIFVKRFGVKLTSRGQAFKFTEEDLLHVLHSIAAASRDNKRIRQSRSDWVDWACGTDFRVEPREARGLYDEALSGGLITEDDSGSWRWRHELVWEYLAEIELV